MSTTSCDYIVVGAGASGMAFVDTLLLHSEEPVSVLLLDKREQPGGRSASGWISAYISGERVVLLTSPLKAETRIGEVGTTLMSSWRVLYADHEETTRPGCIAP